MYMPREICRCFASTLQTLCIPFKYVFANNIIIGVLVSSLNHYHYMGVWECSWVCTFMYVGTCSLRRCLSQDPELIVLPALYQSLLHILKHLWLVSDYTLHSFCAIPCSSIKMPWCIIAGWTFHVFEQDAHFHCTFPSYYTQLRTCSCSYSTLE